MRFMINSNYKLKRKKKKSHIPRRLNILFTVSFLAFVALFVRLGYLQLYKGQSLTQMVERTDSTISTGSVPRGMIYDSLGRIVVGNQPERAILYTRGRDSQVSSKEILTVAKQLASLIELPTQSLTEVDLKNYFLATRRDEVLSRMTAEEKTLKGTKGYQAQLDKIKPEDLNFSDVELEIAMIYNRMSSAYALSTVPIKNKNVTQEEIARISENMSVLPGIQLGTDWQRTYPQGDMLRSILGQVSTEERGIPSDTAKELLTRGYAMNDRVGMSYLEEQYETVLRGTKSVNNIVTDSQDDILKNEQVYPGNKGANLVLTINSDFQKKLDQVVEENLKNIGPNQYLNDRIYVVALNPQNGDILGISGKKFAYDQATDSYNYDQIQDDVLGAINSSYSMGSSVKPAMVATGYQEGAISLTDNVLVDEPMKFQASQVKSSVFNRNGQVPVDDITAIQKSSNIYMIKLAMKIGGQLNYEKEGLLNINPDTINIIRRHFSEFGLGTSTGIDLPNESQGFSPKSNQLVSALDLSYGQFDLYTPLQLGQYAATIANGGKRFSPRLVKEIRSTDSNGELGGVLATVPPKLLNDINIDPAAMDRIHQGMYQFSHTNEGAASRYFLNYPIKLGSKTGTAEAFYSGPIQYAKNNPVTNASFIGFAPYDKPEIAVAVVVPYLKEGILAVDVLNLAKQIMDIYFESQSETNQLIKGQEGVDTNAISTSTEADSESSVEQTTTSVQ
ncbi:MULTISPECIES: peptidoglycan D,D-transpeptidase FtsI family protein [Facklamia]|nr:MULTISPECIES: penicillin-binding protein 2 [Facklamia]OFL65071.1 penicillin-binding protein [Facklamia sp. HMSC062C11]PKY92585.1 penicillin-binding protein 2 [Facklamia hominis]RYC98959.1 penicillin-binding protein 2 [Facklamia hominis]